MKMPDLRSKQGLIIGGVAIGVAYGLVLRIAAYVRLPGQPVVVMSVAFLLLVPLAMGFLAVYFPSRQEPQPVWVWLLLPWVPVLAGAAGTLITMMEGLICVVMYLPIGLVFSSLGGLLAGLIGRSQRLRKLRDATMACVVFFPFLVGPWENAILSKYEVRTVSNVIDVAAPPDVVWNQIQSVPAIRKDELLPSWSRRIGFPDPVEATLSYEGTGSVRHASFTGGVLFVETVDTWQPRHCLGFSIRAQTTKIPHTTLDEHVTIGGPFFDVLHGKYTLDRWPMGPPAYIWKASSAFRLTSTGTRTFGPMRSWPTCNRPFCMWCRSARRQFKCEAVSPL